MYITEAIPVQLHVNLSCDTKIFFKNSQKKIKFQNFQKSQCFSKNVKIFKKSQIFQKNLTFQKYSNFSKNLKIFTISKSKNLMN